LIGGGDGVYIACEEYIIICLFGGGYGLYIASVNKMKFNVKEYCCVRILVVVRDIGEREVG